MGVPHNSNFFFCCNEPIWLAHCKKIEIIEAPKNRRFYGMMKCLPLWPSYISEKGRTLGKTYGIKVRCYWEYPRRTHWEPNGNLKGTCEGQRKKWKNEKIPPPTPPNLKENKIKALWVHSEPSHWLHEISISKTVRHHFWPGLIPPL